jgi:quinol-cytochrome oxidoreductase complex cytochrome b subunit
MSIYLFMCTRWNSNLLPAIVDSHVIDYPAPKNLNYMWSFGSAAGICLGIQLLSGIFLAMHYCANMEYAFYSIEHIMRDVKYGWIIRYMHANGASMFFIAVYAHIFRGLYYGSYMYPRHHLWMSGVVIFLLMMATAFMGYVLPWGQMSFWGATVITNLFSTIPFVGKEVVEWMWGGFSVDNPTLNRFFSLHYTLPFAITGLVVVHLALLHDVGSNNPLGTEYYGDKITFHPYYVVKDAVSFFILLIVFSTFLYFYPNTLNHADNYIPADPLSTPAHIVPEWYFLPFYAILRSIPHKLGGVIAMGGAIVALLVLPFLNTARVRSTYFRPLYAQAYWIFVFNFLFLGWIGQKPVEDPYVMCGVLATVYYFFFFLVIVPVLGFLEENLIDYDSLDSAKN